MGGGGKEGWEEDVRTQLLEILPLRSSLDVSVTASKEILISINAHLNDILKGHKADLLTWL